MVQINVVIKTRVQQKKSVMAVCLMTSWTWGKL